MPSDPTSPEFTEAYNRIHKSFETGDGDETIAPDSIAALVIAFKKSSECAELKPQTKAIYIRHMEMVSLKLGKFPAHKLSRRVVLEWRDQLTETPALANNLVSAIQRLYSFGVDRTLLRHNPFLKIKKLKLSRWRAWKKEEIEAFRKTSPDHLCLALDLALYTGQRLSDVIAMRWNQIIDGGIEVVQQKGGARVWVPLHRNLKASIEKAKAQQEKGTRASITILSTATGLPFKADYLKHKFKDASRSAGLPEDLVFHGLRKSAAKALIEAGCTKDQAKAITGHTTDEMLDYYAEEADQKILAKAAIRKLERRK